MVGRRGTGKFREIVFLYRRVCILKVVKAFLFRPIVHIDQRFFFVNHLLALLRLFRNLFGLFFAFTIRTFFPVSLGSLMLLRFLAQFAFLVLFDWVLHVLVHPFAFHVFILDKPGNSV